MPQKLTKLRLLGHLRKLLARPDTRVINRRLKTCGHSTWDYDTESGEITNITIYVDFRRDGRVRLVLHELLHMLMKLDSSMVYELEESAILAWESLIYSWLHDSKRAKELESWDKAIERKMR
jgi:hypothetical protein